MLLAGLSDDPASSEIVRALSLYGDGSIDDPHYLVASRVVATGTQYVRIAARGPSLPVVVLDIVLPAAMETKVKVIDAGALQSDIARQGHVAPYAVFFNFDRAELKPESKPQIDELARSCRRTRRSRSTSSAIPTASARKTPTPICRSAGPRRWSRRW